MHSTGLLLLLFALSGESHQAQRGTGTAQQARAEIGTLRQVADVFRKRVLQSFRQQSVKRIGRQYYAAPPRYSYESAIWPQQQPFYPMASSYDNYQLSPADKYPQDDYAYHQQPQQFQAAASDHGGGYGQPLVVVKKKDDNSALLAALLHKKKKSNDDGLFMVLALIIGALLAAVLAELLA